MDDLRLQRRAVQRDSSRRTDSLINQKVGGQSPTNRARRSALPRSSWSTVFARIHSPMQSAMQPSDTLCRWIARTPTRRRIVPMVTRHGFPLVGYSHSMLRSHAHRPATGSRRSRRVGAVVRWPVGVGIVAWRYLWRTTVTHRIEEPGDDSDLPKPLPAEVCDDRVQHVEDGHGDLLHRTYSVRIGGGERTPEQLLMLLAADPNAWSPSGMAVFRRTRGTDGAMTVGDEFLIRLPGPWDGPVRVVGSGPRHFRLATLDGHLEAGQIEFRTEEAGEDVRFVVESWARPGDRLSHLLYDQVLIAKEVQLVMWTHACLRAARLAGGRPRGGLTVRTRRLRVDGDGTPTTRSGDTDRTDSPGQV